MLIDDNPRYARDCAEAGIEVLLYDWQLSYPWAKTADGYTLQWYCSACSGVVYILCCAHDLCLTGRVTH